MEKHGWKQKHTKIQHIGKQADIGRERMSMRERDRERKSKKET